MRPVHLALVWHLHQPYYKDDLTDTYLLPWVRLRSTKDYLKMAELAARHPKVAQTFNLVPSLLAQIADYASATPHDLFLELARRPAAELSSEERAFILAWMRESPGFLRVQSSPRYLELATRPADSEFSEQDLRDLQLLSNLVWFDPDLVDRDPRLSELRTKERDYSEADKDLLFKVQLEFVGEVIPRFSELARQGFCELTFSPYHHPILPLLCHVDSARTAIPAISLPQRHFSHREDAEAQIQAGRERFEADLKVHPRGMWPPEMAVGESVAALAVQAGVEWMISDDEVLARSLDIHLERDDLGDVVQPEILYRPWTMERAGGSVSLVFRDSLLSNRIGFDYHRMPAVDAVNDFMDRLRRIQERQAEDDALVVVALDGENAWDFYSREGRDFLELLYERLEQSDDVDCTTVSGFLDRYPARRALPRLHTGSWIGASLDTWIGDSEHNRAWDLLSETRDWLESESRSGEIEPTALARAWGEIRVAEGSDWFWWFGRRHDSGMDEIWDDQFRLHLRNVYKLIGKKPVPALFKPLLQGSAGTRARLPRNEFTPTGAADPAWQGAGHYEVGGGFGALHKPTEVVDGVLYGADQEQLHLRIDGPLDEAALAERQVVFRLYLSGTPAPAEGEAPEVDLPPPLDRAGWDDLGFDPGTLVVVRGRMLSIYRLVDGACAPVSELEIPSPRCFSIPFSLLGRSAGEPVQFALVVSREGRMLEQVPPVGPLMLRVPAVQGPATNPSDRPLRVLIAAAEMAPFARAGSVAHATAQLARELRRLGHDVRVVLPRHRQVDPKRAGLVPALSELAVPLGDQLLECSVLEGRWADVPVYFVEQAQLYDRDAIYGFGDDDARFIYLCRAALEMLEPLGFIPDVVHVHDWHTALIPNLLQRLHADRPQLAGVATVLTIHNLAFQGSFGSGTLRLAGLEPWGLLEVGVGHLDNVVNLLGRGILYADGLSTLSRRYAEEIQTPEFGEGLEELIRSQAHKLWGIGGGLDWNSFDPRHDDCIAHPYGPDDLEGKRQNKFRLQSELGLQQADTPVLAFISRFYAQKGLELIEKALPALAELEVQLIVLGTGDRRDEDMFRYRAAQNPERVAVTIGFDSGLARRIYAGADMLLVPSRCEPAGLGQMIALRYGTVPIVRRTGGLADTVSDYDPASDSGDGFVFDRFDPWQMFAAVVRALETHRHREVWRRLVQRGMRKELSWSASAQSYVELYRSAISAHRVDARSGGQDRAG
ncbi:MAG TPA: glycogen/starch synthase [Candidatus Nitrosotalea sp.]|nr:glycogen/starch synthase [Candidatus Nitrosotalea sp.]